MKYQAMDHGVNIVTLRKNTFVYAMTCAWAMHKVKLDNKFKKEMC